MMDAKTKAKLQDDCTQAAQGYAVATGAAYAAMTSMMFQTWIEGMESVRPGKNKDAEPKSWYRHPDKPSLQSTATSNAATSPWLFGMAQMAQMPIPGWWMCEPTSHPATTWPMAYGLEASGLPKAVAWPLAEANSAAYAATETFFGAITQSVSDDTKSSRPNTTVSAAQTPTEKHAATATSSPMDFAMTLQSANLEMMKNWWDIFQPPATRASK